MPMVRCKSVILTFAEFGLYIDDLFSTDYCTEGYLLILKNIYINMEFHGRYCFLKSSTFFTLKVKILSQSLNKSGTLTNTPSIGDW